MSRDRDAEAEASERSVRQRLDRPASAPARPRPPTNLLAALRLRETGAPHGNRTVQRAAVNLFLTGRDGPSEKGKPYAYATPVADQVAICLAHADAVDDDTAAAAARQVQAIDLTAFRATRAPRLAGLYLRGLHVPTKIAGAARPADPTHLHTLALVASAEGSTGVGPGYKVDITNLRADTLFVSVDTGLQEVPVNEGLLRSLGPESLVLVDHAEIEWRDDSPVCEGIKTFVNTGYYLAGVALPNCTRYASYIDTHSGDAQESGDEDVRDRLDSFTVRSILTSVWPFDVDVDEPLLLVMPLDLEHLALYSAHAVDEFASVLCHHGSFPARLQTLRCDLGRLVVKWSWGAGLPRHTQASELARLFVERLLAPAAPLALREVECELTKLSWLTLGELFRISQVRKLVLRECKEQKHRYSEPIVLDQRSIQELAVHTPDELEPDAGVDAVNLSLGERRDIDVLRVHGVRAMPLVWRLGERMRIGHLDLRLCYKHNDLRMVSMRSLPACTVLSLTHTQLLLQPVDPPPDEPTFQDERQFDAQEAVRAEAFDKWASGVRHLYAEGMKMQYVERFESLHTLVLFNRKPTKLRTVPVTLRRLVLRGATKVNVKGPAVPTLDQLVITSGGSEVQHGDTLSLADALVYIAVFKPRELVLATLSTVYDSAPDLERIHSQMVAARKSPNCRIVLIGSPVRPPAVPGVVVLASLPMRGELTPDDHLYNRYEELDAKPMADPFFE